MTEEKKRAAVDEARDLLIQFSNRRDIADLDAAIRYLEEARVITPAGSPSYATLLTNLATGFADRGQWDEAVSLSREAVEIRRHLAADNPDAYLPDLAMSLNNLGTALSERGQHQEGLLASREAVEIRRHLAADNPDAYLPDLAMSLNNLGTALSDAKKLDEALAAAQEAVQTYKSLATANPAAYEPDLAKALNNLGNRLSDAGRLDEALAAAQEAVQVYKRLAAANPAARTPSLAMVLYDLAGSLSEQRRASVTPAGTEGFGHTLDSATSSASPLPGPSTSSANTQDYESGTRFLTVSEVALIMRISKMTVYRLVHDGELEAVRVGRSFRVPESAVNNYLREAFAQDASRL